MNLFVFNSDCLMSQNMAHVSEREEVDRGVPGPHGGLSEGDGGSDIIRSSIFARAQSMEATRVACQGRPATTDEKFHPIGEAKPKLESVYLP